MSQSLRRNTWPSISLAAMVALTAAGCADGMGPREAPVHYQFALTAFGGDTTAERARSYDCMVYGFFDIPRPVPASGTVRFPVQVQRSLYEHRGSHVELTRADSSIAEAVLEYIGIGDDSLQLVLAAGTYTVSLSAGGLAPSSPLEYAGEWTCGPDVPLAQDSTLLAYGLDPNLQIPGTWRWSEERPIE